MTTPNDFESQLEAARLNPQNMGELERADAVGTVGSPDCGDMLRMWVKFRQREDGKRVIDRATFQTFGCQTAIAVASMATQLIAGKTAEEALAMSGEELAAPLGPLPPMKIHCAQLVEGALRDALTGPSSATAAGAAAGSPAAPSFPVAGVPAATAPTLYDQLIGGASETAAGARKVKLVLLTPPGDGAGPGTAAGGPA